MASLNKISLIGNLGRDPEVRDYQGTKVASFSLAVTERYTKSNGESIENTQWFRVTFWGNTAEIAEKYLTKGSQVYVDGRLSTSEYYSDKEGKDKTSLEVRGQTLKLLGSASGVQTQGMVNTPQTTNQNEATPDPSTEENFPASQEEEDDLPF